MVFRRRASLSNSGATEPLERELAGLAERKAALETELAEARATLSRAHDDRRAALISGSSDPEAIAAHDQACRAADDRVSALEDAALAVGEQVAAADGRLRDARDRAEREIASRELAGLADAAAAALSHFRSTADRMLVAAEAIVAKVPFGGNFAPDLRARANGLMADIAALIAQSKTQATRVAAGTVDAMEPAAPRPAPPPPPPEAERVVVYALEAVRWREADSSERRAPKYGEASIPAPLFARAAQHRLVDRRDGENARRLIELHGVSWGPAPPSSDCVDLETGTAPVGPRNLPVRNVPLHSKLEEIVQGRA